VRLSRLLAARLALAHSALAVARPLVLGPLALTRALPFDALALPVDSLALLGPPPIGLLALQLALAPQELQLASALPLLLLSSEL
jgi:hypothetical protein